MHSIRLCKTLHQGSKSILLVTLSCLVDGPIFKKSIVGFRNCWKINYNIARISKVESKHASIAMKCPVWHRAQPLTNRQGYLIGDAKQQHPRKSTFSIHVGDAVCLKLKTESQFFGEMGLLLLPNSCNGTSTASIRRLIFRGTIAAEVGRHIGWSAWNRASFSGRRWGEGGMWPGVLLIGTGGGHV